MLWQVEATNKWGTVNSKIVLLRLPDEQRAAQPKAAGGDVRVVKSEEAKLKLQPGGSTKRLGGAEAEGSAASEGPDKPANLGRQFSGRI